MKTTSKKQDAMDELLDVVDRLEKKYKVEIAFNVDEIRDVKNNRNNSKVS